MITFFVRFFRNNIHGTRLLWQKLIVLLISNQYNCVILIKYRIRSNMYKLLLFFLSLSSFVVAVAQTVEKQLIMVLPDTSAAILNNADISFASGDQFCYFVRADSLIYDMHTKTDQYGPFKHDGGGGWFHLFYNEKEKAQYIKGSTNAEVYGPIDGTVKYVSTSEKSSLAYTVSAHDSITYFINGKRIAVTDSSTIIDRWCAFNDNGDKLYALRQGKLNYLYFNDKLIDSSHYYYQNLNLDNNSNYSYLLGYYEIKDSKCNCCTFNRLAHVPQNVLIPMQPTIRQGWSMDDTLYHYGNGHNIKYRADSFFVGQTSRTATMLAKGSSIFGYTHSNHWGYIYSSDTTKVKISMNGKRQTLPYEKILLPCIDSMGHYATFGRRGYYMYKNIDGIETKEPLSKHGVRAVPVSIDVKGNTICYYETEDSVYVYENDHLFKSCAVGQFEFMLRYFFTWQYVEDQVPPLLVINGAAYIVYNNTISPALLKPNARTNDRYFDIGDVICSLCNESGYYMLQKTGEQQYDLLVNNRRISLPSEISFEGPLWDKLTFNFQLKANEFVFYGIEGKSIYKYKIAL